MADRPKEQNHQPLLYKVEPKAVEQTIAKGQSEVKQEQREVEQTPSSKDEKIEQLKREFGVYEALAEVEREKAIASEWTQAYRKQERAQEQEKIEQQPTYEQQAVQVQTESSTTQEKAAPKRRKKKQKKEPKKESVTEIITRLVHSSNRNIPMCEGELFGEKTQFQVLGLRGEVVKIRIGYRIRYIKLSDISQLQVISGEK